ncbi:MAG: hypothetical protein WAU01_04595 [Saprospiraceae bacterium]
MAKSLTIIRSRKQYMDYCDLLEELVLNKKGHQDEVDLLSLLINKWDQDNLESIQTDPIELIRALMRQNDLNSINMAEILSVNKSTVSRILNYQKGLSKKSIRTLSEYFAIAQESLNKPYKLKHELNKKFKNAALMNTKKKIELV